jgi:NADP-dependent aldehyde dehydrogenase
MLQGATNETGALLVEHPETRAVAFTGSLRGGRALFDIAAARPIPIPVYAEMGSVNPQFVLPGKLEADPVGFAEGLFGSITLGNGQFCTCPSVVFVPDAAALDAMTAKLSELIADCAGAPLLNKGIAAGFDAGVASWESLAGIEILSKGSLTAAQVGAAPVVAKISLEDFEKNRDALSEEVFGPSTILVVCPDAESYAAAAEGFDGQLGASIHGADEELAGAGELMGALANFSGRVCVNGFPTGIEVCDSVHHGGPYPATTDAQHTSIGTAGITRWGRPVSYQNTPDALLPGALKNANPLGLMRLVDGEWSDGAVG